MQDRQMDIFQYEQTHNMSQVWKGKLSELQLPVQWTEGQTDGVKPIYSPTTLLCGGYNKSFH